MKGSFLETYPSRVDRLLTQMNETTGTHPVNRRAADQWVQRQKTSLRRETARDLLKHTYYITFRDICTHVGTIVEQIYRDHAGFADAERIYLYVGAEQKSFYLIATLALYWIRKRGHREPTDFVETITDAVLQDSVRTGSPILMLDDFAFSGSQMSEFLQKILDKTYLEPNLASIYGPVNRSTTQAAQLMKTSYTAQGKLQDIPPEHIAQLLESFTQSPPNLILGLVGVNSVSLAKLRKMYLYRPYLWGAYETPVQLYYGQTYPTLVESVGPQRFFNILYFFSNQTGPQPYLSLYTDIKLADMPSTFTRVLAYGPIPPSYYPGDVYSAPLNRGLPEMFNNVSFAAIAPEITRDTLVQYYQQVVARETADLGSVPVPVPAPIEFVPFVTLCRSAAFLDEIREQLSYLEFLVWDPEADTEITAELTPGKRELIQRIDAYRCPSRT